MDGLLEPWLSEKVLLWLVLASAVLFLLPWRGWTGRTHTAFLATLAGFLLAGTWRGTTGLAVLLLPILLPLVVLVLAGAIVVVAFPVAFAYRRLGIAFGPAKPTHLALLAIPLTIAFFLGFAWILPKAWEFEVTREWESVPIMAALGERVHFDLTANPADRYSVAVYRTRASHTQVWDFYLEEMPGKGWTPAKKPTPALRFCKPNGYILELRGPGNMGEVTIPRSDDHDYLREFDDLVTLTLQRIDYAPSFDFRCN